MLLCFLLAPSLLERSWSAGLWSRCLVAICTGSAFRPFLAPSGWQALAAVQSLCLSLARHPHGDWMHSASCPRLGPPPSLGTFLQECPYHLACLGRCRCKCEDAGHRTRLRSASRGSCIDNYVINFALRSPRPPSAPLC